MDEMLRYFHEKDRLGRTLGVRLTHIAPGEATAELHLEPHLHHNALGITHGGTVFTLADIAFAAASNAYGTVAVAIQVNIVYMRASSTGTLTAKAREISRTRKLGIYQIDITDDAGELVATFQGTAFRKDTPLHLA